MLDFFLVLGQIPGTNFTLTFNEVVLAALVLAAPAYFWLKGEKPQKPIITVWDSLVSYENRPLSLPVEWTPHKGAAQQANTNDTRITRHSQTTQ